MPLRAIIFQFLFLLLAIAIEGLVFHRILNIEHRTCMQYSATINLLSTLVGWLVFFAIQPLLPPNIKIQLLSYIFFERLFSNPSLSNVAPILVGLGLVIFIGTFFLELKGLELLEVWLKKTEEKDDKGSEKPFGFRGRQNQAIGFRVNSKAYAIFVGNACSFTVIVLILITRFFDQTHYSVM